MLAAISYREVDYSPLCFMLYNGLLATCNSYLEFIQRETNLGLDTFMQIPPRYSMTKSDSYNLHGLPVNYHPEVSIREWKEHSRRSRWPILYKEYHTPDGTLRSEVNQDEEWPVWCKSPIH